MVEDSALEDVAGRLRRNEEGYTTLQLQLNPGWEAADIDSVTESLRMNHTLQGIEFFGILADDDVNEAVGRLFASFGGLPNLTTLKVSGYCEGMVRALGRVVSEATKLETLHVTYVQLDGFHEDFVYFAESIQRHSSLRDFQIVDCQLPERFRGADVLPFSIMSMLLDSLPAISSLREVEISPIEKTSLGPISSNSLVALCRSMNLKRLDVSGFAEFFQDETVDEDSTTYLEVMTEALHTNVSIREFNIQSSFSKRQCEALSDLLSTNTTLESLGVLFEGDTFENEAHCIKIAEALQTNTTLQSLTFRGPICPNMSCETLKAFAKMMEINVSLKRITFLPSPAENIWTLRIAMFQKLNEKGRGEFLRTEGRTRGQWLDKLLEVQNDLDCLFYFLSVSPSYCSS